MTILPRNALEETRLIVSLRRQQSTYYFVMVAHSDNLENLHSFCVFRVGISRRGGRISLSFVHKNIFKAISISWSWMSMSVCWPAALASGWTFTSVRGIMASHRIVLSFVLVLSIKACASYNIYNEDLVLIDEGSGKATVWTLKIRKSVIINVRTWWKILCLVCYSVVFTGRRLSQRYIERSVSVISLDECKLLCTRETSFDCRSFNYRYIDTAFISVVLIRDFYSIVDAGFWAPIVTWVVRIRPVWTWRAVTCSSRIPTSTFTSASAKDSRATGRTHDRRALHRQHRPTIFTLIPNLQRLLNVPSQVAAVAAAATA